jgi:Fic-DOC domain mobile mystery protein B
MGRGLTGEVLKVEDDASTPLTGDELSGLIPSWITWRHELNEAEQDNILAAMLWAARQNRRELLDEKFLCDLHKRMLGKVWRWAGVYRTTARNVGVEASQIRTELRLLLDDARFWIANKAYEPDELAVRFHHRLVWVHPFPNGNGRHSRLMADLLVMRSGAKRFTWGSAGRVAGDVRKQYIAAIRKADRHDIGELLVFARS